MTAEGGLRGVLAQQSQPYPDMQNLHWQGFLMLFAPLWGRVIPLADNEQETSLEVWDIWAASM